MTATVATLVATASNPNQNIGQTFGLTTNSGTYYTASIQTQQHNWTNSGNLNRNHQQHTLHNVSRFLWDFRKSNLGPNHV